MLNLLSANLFRLRKSLLFWICLLLSAAAGAWQPFNFYMNYKRDYPLDTSLFVYAMLIGLLLSVFLPLFFGAEYSDGAIRNKLAAGHTRRTVYLANLTAAVLTALSFCGTCLLFTLAVGIPLLGLPKAPAGLLLTVLLLSLLMAAVWCSVYTAIIMNCSRKAASAVSCILLFLALFLAATTVYQLLEAPEYYPAYKLVNGEMVSEIVRNPTYLQPEERRVYELILDLNPTGQGVQCLEMAIVRPVQMALCSLGVAAAATAAGTALFRRKDLR